MRKLTALLLLSTVLITPVSLVAAKPSKVVPKQYRVFVEPQNGFESYVAAAIVKKEVPVTVTLNKADADYILTSTIATMEEKSGLGKIARCAFAYCVGIDGSQTVTVQLLKKDAQEVTWAYNVRKMGAQNFQSSAEAIAKHLKEYLKKAK